MSVRVLQTQNFLELHFLTQVASSTAELNLVSTDESTSTLLIVRIDEAHGHRLAIPLLVNSVSVIGLSIETHPVATATTARSSD